MRPGSHPKVPMSTSTICSIIHHDEPTHRGVARGIFREPRWAFLFYSSTWRGRGMSYKHLHSIVGPRRRLSMETGDGGLWLYPTYINLIACSEDSACLRRGCHARQRQPPAAGLLPSTSTAAKCSLVRHDEQLTGSSESRGGLRDVFLFHEAGGGTNLSSGMGRDH